MADLRQKVFDQLKPICRKTQGLALRSQCKATIEIAINEGEINHSDILADQFIFESHMLAEKFQYNPENNLTSQKIVEIIFWIAVDSYIEEWMNSST
jgi:hypothetical protein